MDDAVAAGTSSYPAHERRSAVVAGRRAFGLAVLALVATVAVVHSVSRAGSLTELDSGNLAKALDDFDVSLHQPHPPGYPLQVGLAHLLTWIGGALPAYLLTALLFSLGAIVVTALLGAELFGAAAAVPAAAVLVASPLFLFYADVVSVYPAEAFFGPLVVLVGARAARRADPWSAALLPVVLAVGGGFRPSMIVLLSPVVALALSLARPLGRREAAGLAVGLLVLAGWLVPTIVESGGLHAYLDASRLYERAAERTALPLGGDVKSNLALTVVGFGLAALPAAVLGAVGLLRRPALQARPWLLLGTWVVPYLLLYGLVHLGKPGYVLGVLPALCVAAGGLAVRQRLAPLVAGAAMLVGLAYFLAAPNVVLPPRIEGYRPLAFAPTRSAIRLQDDEAHALQRLVATCRRPACTIVSTGSSNRVWEHDPWSLQRAYVPDGVPRVRELVGASAPRGVVLWVGARPPAAVAARAEELERVGTWRVLRSNAEETRSILAALAAEGSP